MVLDSKVNRKVPPSLEIAEPTVRKGRVMGGRGSAGQKRKRFLALIAADKKKQTKKSRNLSIEGPRVTCRLSLNSFCTQELCAFGPNNMPLGQTAAPARAPPPSPPPPLHRN